MKSIIISINPEWVEEILNGEKTIEIRKTAPKCDLPIDVYIYCTKGGDVLWTNVLNNNFYLNLREDHVAPGVEKRNGKVVAKFTLREVEGIKLPYTKFGCNEWVGCEAERTLQTQTMDEPEILRKACLCEDEIYSYLNFSKRPCGYAWHISDIVIFDEPKELGEFMPVCSKKKCNGCKYFGGQHEWDIVCNHPRPLSKAPQSWCYVEVRE